MSDPGDWNAKTIAEFRANEGKVGGVFEGAPMVLVHHRGRKSGQERVTPTMYLPDDTEPGTIYVFATKAGAPGNPDWYRNLTAAGDGSVERGTETYKVTVHELTGAERDRIYAEQARRYPGFAEYERQTAGVRTIPVLELRRAYPARALARAPQRAGLPRSSAAGCLGAVICAGRESAGLVCGAFGLLAEPGAALIPVSRGAMGRVWRLDLGAERYAVKELFWESDEEPVRAEAAFTAHLESAGIRLAGSLPGRGGRFLQELAPGDGGGWLRLYRWIDGVPVDLADPGLAVQVGDLAGRLHALARPDRGAVDPWYDAVPEPATWDQLADAARGQGAGWAEAMAGHAGLLRDLAGLVTRMAGDRLVTCHRDLHPDNVLVEASGELAVLDWDEAGPACPGRELAGLLMFWHGHDDGTADDAAVQRTLAAYCAAGGPGQLRDEQSFGMYIACRLNFLENQASVALDPGAAPEHRAWASSEIADTLARLPAPSLISHLTSLATAILG